LDKLVPLRDVFAVRLDEKDFVRHSDRVLPV
jgi:hypothetical protein